MFSSFIHSKRNLIFAGLVGSILMLGVFSVDNLAALLREGNYLFNLVTKQNSLGRYVPDDLRELTLVGAPGKYVRENTYQPILDLVSAAEKDGVDLKILSAYRSYEYQEDLHEYYSRNYPGADRFSAEAGHSEHQLGTTVDFGAGSVVDLTQNFANTSQGKWLEKNAVKYGFVMSYPPGKEHITGYIYEPWHYRFIGKEAAEDFLTQNISLTEYLERSPQYYVKESLYEGLVRLRGANEIYYVTSKGYKRHLPSPEVFESYNNNWQDVILIDPDTLQSLPSVKFVHLQGRPEIYYLADNGTKKEVLDEKVIDQLNYSRDGIAPINQTEFNWYPTASSISDASQINNSDNNSGNYDISEIIFNNVPFAAQAPLGNWEDERQQNGCEEAAALMAMHWVRNDMDLPLTEARDTIIAISDWEQKTYGEFHDASAEDTASRIFKGYFKYDNVRVEKNITAEDIKRELKNGNLVIVPANGRKLNNPYFTLPGPIEHMLLVIGYDPNTDEFITNENGTRHGKSYRYKTSVFEDALQDYPTGFHLPIERIEKNMIVIGK